VTAQPLAPVIPSSGISAARRRAKSAAGRSLPLARPEPVPSAPQNVVYGIGCIDASGRIADRAVISALGWSGGDRLTLTDGAGVVTARRDPGEMITLPGRAYIAIPAMLRRRCGLRPGDRVLLAAVPGDDMLSAYSLAVVDQAVRAHGAFPHAQGGQPWPPPRPFRPRLSRPPWTRKVDKPRCLPSTRRAVADTRLAEINQIAATTGDDPELDTLILRLHTETACRRGGALALRPQDLDPLQCLVLLREKGETVRWQPVSPTLMAGLVRHAEERHARRTDGCCATATGGR
jgi:hypothetical protein